MKRITLFILSFCLVGLAPNLPSSALAQNPLLEALSDTNQEEAPVDLETQTREQQQKLREAFEILSTQSPISPEEAQELKKQKALLEELRLAYEQILVALARQKEFQENLKNLQTKWKNWKQKSKNEKLSLSFTELDKLADQRQLEVGQLAIIENSLKTLKSTLEKTKENFISLEKERRLLQEEIEHEQESLDIPTLQNRLRLLKRESQIAQARISLTKTQIQNENLLKQSSELNQRLLNKQLEFFQDKVGFEESDLQEELKLLEAEKASLQKALATVRESFEEFEKQALKIPQELRFAERQRYQTRISLLAQRYQRLDELEETWHWRYQVWNQANKKSQLLEWEAAIQNALQDVGRQESLLNVRIAELRKNLTKLENQLQQEEFLSPEQKKNLTLQQEQQSSLLAAHQDYLSQLYRESQLYKKVLAEIEPHTAHLNFSDRVAQIWEKVLKVWNFELTSIDDKPITVKKLFFVLILLLLGFRLSRRASHWFGKKLFPRFGLETGVAAGLQTLSFYVLIALVTLLVLYMVNVPLTMFTVLGGALAIGIGFGSQNIVRNFISGLILLMEQPIKVGDMVEVDGTYGTIEKVGARSTRIRGFNNVHAIVPNSDLLEKKVINWTLSDDLIRIVVTVGVAYGSPTREVAKLIRKAVIEHGKVLKTPDPIILFKEFGDNALHFEVHFWIKMRVLMDREKIESDIRFRIDSLFRNAHITIAFPQRDVHLDTLSPLEVKLTTPTHQVSHEELKAKLKEKLKEQPS